MIEGAILEFGKDRFAVITSIDFQHEVGAFKLFLTKKDAEKFVHDVSQKTFPGFHSSGKCPVCGPRTPVDAA